MSDSSDSQNLAAISRDVLCFGPYSGSSEDRVNNHVTLARSIIRFLDQSSLLPRVASLEDSVLIVSKLQGLAYHQPEAGSIQDIATWCVRQWLRLLQHHPDDVDILQGLGKAWLLHSQASLARIHIEEGASSSDELADMAHATNEANLRRHTADYVEVRGTLMPATEYLARAVSAAERQGALQGRLLCAAADAYMSLGTVSYTPDNERYFRQAVLYLRRATQIQGFTLDSSMQRFLEEYSALID